MQPAPFAYHRAFTVEEAIATVSGVKDGQFLAGGQSLVAMMNARQVEPKHVVDINPIPELSQMFCDAGQLHIGALTRHDALCRSADLQALGAPCNLAGFLAAAGGHIGNLVIRNRGTIGGSLALAEPHAEWLLAMQVLDASLVIAGPPGRRSCGIGSFLAAPRGSALGTGELIVAARVVLPSPTTRYGFGQTLLRHEGRRISVGAKMTGEGDNRRLDLAISGTGLLPTPLFGSDAPPAPRDSNGAAELAAIALARSGLFQADDFALHVARTTAAEAIGQVYGDG